MRGGIELCCERVCALQRLCESLCALIVGVRSCCKADYLTQMFAGNSVMQNCECWKEPHTDGDTSNLLCCPQWSRSQVHVMMAGKDSSRCRRRQEVPSSG